MFAATPVPESPKSVGSSGEGSVCRCLTFSLQHQRFGESTSPQRKAFRFSLMQSPLTQRPDADGAVFPLLLVTIRILTRASTFHDHGIDEVPGDMKEQLATVGAATVSAHQQVTFLCPHRRPNCGEVLTRDHRTSNFISLVSPSLDIAGPNTYSPRQPFPATKPSPIQASPSTGHRKHV